MNEPIIVYTLFALIATGCGSLVIGAVGGWFVRQHQDQQLLSVLNERLERRQTNSTEQHIELEAANKKLTELENVARMQGKRDRIIKDLLKKQNRHRKNVKNLEDALEESTALARKTTSQLAQARKDLIDSTVKKRIMRRQYDALKKKFAASQQLASEIASQSASQAAAHNQAAILATETTASTNAQPMQAERQPIASAAVVVKIEAEEKHTAASTMASTATGAKVSVQGQRPASKSAAPKLKIINNSVEPAKGDTQSDKTKAAAKNSEMQSTKVAASNPTKTDGNVQSKSRATSTTPKPKSVATSTSGKKRKSHSRISKAAAAKVKDDLKKIKGIGPAIEVALNSIGIERYEQLAGLDAKAVRELDNKLTKFSGRIARDNWVASARQLRKKLSA